MNAEDHGKEYLHKTAAAFESYRQDAESQLAHLRAKAAQDAETIKKLEKCVCQTCGGSGTLGNPPDDYYNCPDCTGKWQRMHDELRQARETAAEWKADLRAMTETKEFAAGVIAERDRTILELKETIAVLHGQKKNNLA